MNEMKQQNVESREIAQVKMDISSQVLAKVKVFEQAGALKLPEDYSPENALKAAYLVLTDPKSNLLTKCTKTSVANALLKMVVWGLSPLKTQCYFVPYNDKSNGTTTLECMVSYTGNVVTAKRYGNLKNIKANVIYKGDDFEFMINEFGRRKIVHHKQTLESIGGDIIGAYAVFELNDGTTDMELMTMAQIQTAWSQGYDSPAKRKFPEEMAKKTVINRACKMLIRSSDDGVLGNDEPDRTYSTEEQINDEQENIANQGEEIGFEEMQEEVVQELDSPQVATNMPAPESSQEQKPETKVPF